MVAQNKIWQAQTASRKWLGQQITKMLPNGEAQKSTHEKNH